MNRDEQRMDLIRSCLSGVATQGNTTEIANNAIAIADAVLAVLEKRHDTLPCEAPSDLDEEEQSRTRRVLASLASITEHMLPPAHTEGSR